MKYTSEQLHAAAHEMQQVGGTFAYHIAAAYFYADSNNRERILTAFMDLFERYMPGTEYTFR